MDLDNIVDSFQDPNHRHVYAKNDVRELTFDLSYVADDDCGAGVVPNRIPPSFEMDDVGVSRS